MLNQENYSPAFENHCVEGEAKREEMRRGKNFSLPPRLSGLFQTSCYCRPEVN